MESGVDPCQRGLASWLFGESVDELKQCIAALGEVPKAVMCHGGAIEKLRVRGRWIVCLTAIRQNSAVAAESEIDKSAVDEGRLPLFVGAGKVNGMGVPVRIPELAREL